MQIHGLGEDTPSFWAQLASALPAVATAAAQVITATRSPAITGTQANPGGAVLMGYQNGVPVYAQSSPAGVTPLNPYSLPSGMINPVGVSPQYSAYGASAYGAIPAQASYGGMSTTTLLLIGGGALVALLLLTQK